MCLRTVEGARQPVVLLQGGRGEVEMRSVNMGEERVAPGD